MCASECEFPIEIPEIRDVSVNPDSRDPVAMATVTVRTAYPVASVMFWVAEGDYRLTQPERPDPSKYRSISYYPVFGTYSNVSTFFSRKQTGKIDDRFVFPSETLLIVE